ncbi:plant virulence effector HPE1-like domain-containing protein [Rhizobium puerariae]|uniref:Plant virulence effector HPE1-like domain-containing protein n=1 Tax=Rhizobium puerariae TaxID=1585791 RepID=A0ABV6AIF2_9HYPH
MRLVLTTVLVFASGAAFASSITAINGSHAAGTSIVEKRCEGCPAAKPKVNQATYKVPELASGKQKVEIVDINGEKKLARTEAWFGGSPVIHISKVPEWMAPDSAIADLHPAADGSTETGIATIGDSRDGVDLDATTSAVDPLKEKAESTEISAAPSPAATGQFELRLTFAE